VVEACRAKRWFCSFFSDRKMLLCSVTSTRIALAILAEQNAGFALFLVVGKCIKMFISLGFNNYFRLPDLCDFTYNTSSNIIFA
jgi:hypothetical protein